MIEQSALEPLRRRIALLESESEIRRVVAAYFRLCDTLGPDTPMERLGALFTRDAVWAGEGRYRAALGRYQGREAIVAMLDRYADPPHFALNGHYLSSEAIDVRDETSATGCWMMLQVSTYRDGRSDLRSAALNIDFSHADSAWRIARFTTRHVFSRDVGPWNDEAAIPVPESIAKEGA